MKNTPPFILRSAAIVALVAISFVGCRPNKERDVYYGKLQDQGFEPVADAEVTAKLAATNSATNPLPVVVKSDANGLFRFKLLSGEKLELTPRKQGYALADTNTTIQLKSSPGNQFTSNQPTVIKMWKLQGAEPLANFMGKSQFQNAGVPVYYDFVNKAFSADSGDIKITVLRPDGTIAPSEQPDWSVQLESTAEGGLIEITPDIWRTTSWAPPAGYELIRNLLVSTKTSHPWSTNAQGYFFTQTRHGSVYAKMAVNVTINPDPKGQYAISVAGIANTNGSCNWEANVGSPTPQ